MVATPRQNGHGRKNLCECTFRNSHPAPSIGDPQPTPKLEPALSDSTEWQFACSSSSANEHACVRAVTRDYCRATEMTSIMQRLIAFARHQYPKIDVQHRLREARRPKPQMGVFSPKVRVSSREQSKCRCRDIRERSSAPIRFMNLSRNVHQLSCPSGDASAQISPAWN